MSWVRRGAITERGKQWEEEREWKNASENTSERAVWRVNHLFQYLFDLPWNGLAGCCVLGFRGCSGVCWLRLLCTTTNCGLQCTGERDLALGFCHCHTPGSSEPSFIHSLSVEIFRARGRRHVSSWLEWLLKCGGRDQRDEIVQLSLELKNTSDCALSHLL